MPRAASSWWKPDATMCSLVESSPFHMIITGRGPSPGAWEKYAGSAPSANGISTRVVAGSMSSNDSVWISRRCW